MGLDHSGSLISFTVMNVIALNHLEPAVMKLILSTCNINMYQGRRKQLGIGQANIPRLQSRQVIFRAKR